MTSDPKLKTGYLALFIIYTKRVYHKGKRLIQWYWAHLFKNLGLIFKDKPKAKYLLYIYIYNVYVSNHYMKDY